MGISFKENNENDNFITKVEHDKIVESLEKNYETKIKDLRVANSSSEDLDKTSSSETSINELGKKLKDEVKVTHSLKM